MSINGVIFPVRGSVKIDPTKTEVTEGANIDGSIYVTSKPVVPTVEATLSDSCGLSLTQLMSLRCSDVVVELPEVGRTFILVNGTIAGRPSLNPETGEISGIKLIGSNIRELLDNV